MAETTKQSETERPERCPRLVITPTQWKQGWIEYRPGNAITAVNREYANPVKRPDGNYEVDDPDWHSPVSEVKPPALVKQYTIDRCAKCGCTREDLLHRRDELIKRLRAIGVEGEFSKDCHDFVEAAQPPAAAGSEWTDGGSVSAAIHKVRAPETAEQFWPSWSQGIGHADFHSVSKATMFEFAEAFNAKTAERMAALSKEREYWKGHAEKMEQRIVDLTKELAVPKKVRTQRNWVKLRQRAEKDERELAEARAKIERLRKALEDIVEEMPPTIKLPLLIEIDEIARAALQPGVSGTDEKGTYNDTDATNE